MDLTYQDVKANYDKFIMNTYVRNDVVFVKGSGSRLIDINGKTYLDFACGISVCNLGHCHPAVTEAIAKQAGELVHVSNLFMNTRQAELAEKIVKHTFDGVVFFSNSGAESNEGLIKFARKHGNANGRNEIIVMNDSFHGRTLATLAATGRSKYRKGFEPDMQGFVFVPFNDIDAVKKAYSEKTCAVMFECIQGEGGIIPADPEFMKQVRAFCDEKGILMLIDEVQTGNGRTGHFYAWQGYGVEPDAFSTAKAIANGFPMGFFMVKRRYADILGPGTHASTFGGTALACAAACAVIDTIDHENLLANATEQGDYIQAQLREKLQHFPFVKTVRGRGLLIGVVLDRAPGVFLPLLREKGLIALPAGETVLRLLPPLNVTRAEADEAIAIIADVFAHFQA